jgi:hypothetical protein
VKPCGPELYELIPKRNIRIDIAAAARVLERDGFQIIERSDLVLHVRDEHEISIYPSGKILVFPAKGAEAAASVGHRMMAILEKI